MLPKVQRILAERLAAEEARDRSAEPIRLSASPRVKSPAPQPQPRLALAT